MNIQNIKKIWKWEFKTVDDLNEQLQGIKEEGNCEVISITQFEYSNGGTGYYLWLAVLENKEKCYEF